MNNTLNLPRLFLIGNLSIFMIDLGFAVRANIATDLQTDLYGVLDAANSAALVGQALGSTFIGFALTLLLGSALVDLLGIKFMMLLSALAYIVGSALVLGASVIEPSWTAVNLVWVGLLFTGIGWGAVEAASNPMVAAIYPDEKTKRLNILHAWWPAGIVIGGLMGVALGRMELPWTLNLWILIVPSLVLALLVISTQFPLTERAAMGVSYSDMFKELARSPSVFIWFGCMFFTASAELAPGQWVDITLSNVVGMEGILVLVYVSALMFVMRHFAGAIEARLSAPGLLTMSCILAAAGLYTLSIANSPILAFMAATLWALGVCFMWPTMIACIASRYARGGALFMGILGFCGGMAIQFVLPQLGAIFDSAKAKAANGADLSTLPPEQMTEIIRYASVESFQAVAIIPLIVAPVFALIWWNDKRKSQT